MKNSKKRSIGVAAVLLAAIVLFFNAPLSVFSQSAVEDLEKVEQESRIKLHGESDEDSNAQDGQDQETRQADEEYTSSDEGLIVPTAKTIRTGKFVFNAGLIILNHSSSESLPAMEGSSVSQSDEKYNQAGIGFNFEGNYYFNRLFGFNGGISWGSSNRTLESTKCIAVFTNGSEEEIDCEAKETVTSVDLYAGGVVRFITGSSSAFSAKAGIVLHFLDREQKLETDNSNVSSKTTDKESDSSAGGMVGFAFQFTEKFKTDLVYHSAFGDKDTTGEFSKTELIFSVLF